MTTFETGRRAEAAAAEFLERKGFEILDQNWRTRMCEIDLVARRNDELCFCEVKYRATNRQGSGVEYVTPQKLKQMRFAAESWVHARGWQGEYELAVIEVSGESFRVTNAIRGLG